MLTMVRLKIRAYDFFSFLFWDTLKLIVLAIFCACCLNSASVHKINSLRFFDASFFRMKTIKSLRVIVFCISKYAGKIIYLLIITQYPILRILYSTHMALPLVTNNEFDTNNTNCMLFKSVQFVIGNICIKFVIRNQKKIFANSNIFTI